MRERIGIITGWTLIIIVFCVFISYAVPPTPPTVNISGNAATATSLASNPTDCGANTVATAIDSSGNLTCNQSIGSLATQNADNATITGGSITGLTALQATKVDWGKASDIASASTTDIGAANGVVLDITGTNTITSFGNVTAGITRLVRFTGATTITYNATSMILPGSKDITTAAGDRATFVSLGSGNWLCHSYMKAAGTAIGMLNETVVASNATLTRDVMFGGQINTYGQNADTTITLLAIEKGMNFCVVVGTTVAKYLRVDPNASDSIYDGTTTAGDGKYFGVTSAAAGQKICFEAFQTGASAYDWSISYLGPWASE